MSIEKLINNDKLSIDEIKKAEIDKNHLKYIEKIKNIFWIPIETAKELTKLKSFQNRDLLINDINKLNINKKEKEKIKDIDRLQDILKEYKVEKENILKKYENKKDILNKSIKNKLNIVKYDQIEFITYNNSKIEKIFPNIYKKAINTEKIFKNISIWLLIWTWETILKLWDNIIKLWIDIIKLPYDIFKLISWKSKINYKKI